MDRAVSSDIPIRSVETEDDSINKSEDVFEDFRQLRCHRRMARRTVSPPQAPKASDVYLAQAKLPPIRNPSPKKLLVVLDLNGTLIVRPSRHKDPAKFKIRPGVPVLLEYLFKSHVVMIYTSMQPWNAHVVVDRLLSTEQRRNLAGLWTRDMLELSKQQRYEKVQVYKRLDKIWRDKSIQAFYPRIATGEGGWNQRNTVQIDDNELKGLSEPHNLLQVPEFKHNSPIKDKALAEKYVKQEEGTLNSLVLKLEELKYQQDVSRLILQWQTGKAEIPGEPGTGTAAEDKAQKNCVVHLPTPERSSDADLALSEDSQDDEVQQELSWEMAKLSTKGRK